MTTRIFQVSVSAIYIPILWQKEDSPGDSERCDLGDIWSDLNIWSSSHPNAAKDDVHFWGVPFDGQTPSPSKMIDILFDCCIPHQTFWHVFHQVFCENACCLLSIGSVPCRVLQSCHYQILAMDVDNLGTFVVSSCLCFLFETIEYQFTDSSIFCEHLCFQGVEVDQRFFKMKAVMATSQLRRLWYVFDTSWPTRR